MESNTFVIGDIHGGLAAVKQVLERAKVTRHDQLIFLGDYVDGWGESRQVLEFLMELREQQDCIFLKGNHDQWCEEWLMTGNVSEVCYAHGGKATMMSYEGIDEAAREKHIDFFGEMLTYHIDSKKRLFVHAGFVSTHGPEYDNEGNLLWERTLWEMAAAMDKNLDRNSVFFPKRLKLFEEIYIGHTPTSNYEIYEPMNVYNLWNIDTGAAFGGSLTILNVNTKQYWQSDRLNTLYPNEVGRRR